MAFEKFKSVLRRLSRGEYGDLLLRYRKTRNELELAETRARKLLADNARYKGSAVRAALAAEGRLIEGTKPAMDISVILSQMQSLGLEINRLQANEAEFDDWYRRMDYEGSYPAYKAEFGRLGVLRRKALEHYLSIILCEIRPEDVVMDVASSNSIVPELLKKRHGVRRVYRQDLRYPKGVHGMTVGSDAASIPLPDESIDVMTLHNSIEHFEDGADAKFILEAVRLLRSGGRLCVIPLFAAEELAIASNPELWLKFGVPDFLPSARVHLVEIDTHHGTFVSAKYLKEAYADPIGGRADCRIIHFENFRAVTGCMPLAMLIRKK